MEQKENDVKRGVETLDRNSIIARNLWGGLEEAVTIPPREEGALLPRAEAPIELGRGGATGEKAVTPPGEKESVLSKEANEVTRKDQITQTQSQQELSVEELFQQVREREIKLLLRAGFPDANSNGQSQSYAAEKQ
ncbi:uncharacterized protein LOC134267844, partial [Saccostrea cucullata]|uniref:uncharacterized protein LOC134267844 n=1 Tax=Saccostrea cuccullata TaxID=36930 RepID=UPI002ED65424